MQKIKKSMNKVIYLIFIILAGCGADQFAPKRVSDNAVVPGIEQNTAQSCSAFTLVKPKVDFLFLWDNSTSSTFINPQTKAALNNTIDLVSSRFDYHVLLAPLVTRTSDSLNYQAKLISENTDGLNSSALSMKIDRSLASDALNFNYSAGSQEKGVKRAIDLIKGNISNGIFRSKSYLYVVVLSNQNDSSWQQQQVAAADENQYLDEQFNRLICVRNPVIAGANCTGAALDSYQLRFMNITAFSDDTNGASCPNVSRWDAGSTYQKFASRVYSEPYPDPMGGAPVYRQLDQNDRPYTQRDSYDLCSQSSFTSIFDGINASINDTLIQHKYNYWPVATSGASAIDPNEIRVIKNGVEMPRLNSPIPFGASGFTFTNTVQTVNTRYAPTPGESFSGYVVRLYGNAEVTYPECISVQTQSPKEWFGYINLQTKPVESSIAVKINGQTVSQSSTNGWQLIKSAGQPAYFSSKNIKITAPGAFCPSNSTTYCEGSPPLNKSGYFLQLNGNAVYSNGAVIEVIYDPST
jgi:hypothetical protein